MKMKLMMTVTLSVLLLSACSSFRETGISEDGEIRQIMTEHSEEIELPADPKRVALFRGIDAGNAELLDGNLAGVNEIARRSEYAKAFLDEDITYLEHGDLDALKALDPDLIITYTPDEHLFEYQEIAPTVQVNYSTSAFSPFKERLYLSHLFTLGVILNKQEEAEKLGDEWLEASTRLQRQAGDIVSGQTAMVLSKEDDGYYLYDEYTSFGTEAVYDVLKFGIDESLAAELEEKGAGHRTLEGLQGIESDYVFVNVREDEGDGVRQSVSEALGVPPDNVILLDYGSFRLNDLISVEKQTKEIIERIK
ncbi:ABC transporter substrate-binding protein [Salinicoccus sp. HZC-1]|uniref:ABC transporter substrate-binding protein n=1 Tax=Salinicoccus sp. HZC-1 TaxID=3385497 RepID=UPI00398B0FFC